MKINKINFGGHPALVIVVNRYLEKSCFPYCGNIYFVPVFQECQGNVGVLKLWYYKYFFLLREDFTGFFSNFQYKLVIPKQTVDLLTVAYDSWSIDNCYDYIFGAAEYNKRTWSKFPFLCSLILSRKMLKTGQTYLTNLALRTLQDFESMFDNFNVMHERVKFWLYI